MTHDLLESFGAIAVAVHDEIHASYPELLREREPSKISDEALVAWRLLLATEELFCLIVEVEKHCVRPAVEAEDVAATTVF